jgi:hypothetical protein
MLAWLLIFSIPFSIVLLIIWDACNFERERSSQRSDIAVVVSVAAAVCSALFAGATFVFANFYRPEDLVVSARVLVVDQIGSPHLDVSLVFSNVGRQPIVIENVLLAQDYGKTARFENASDWNLAGSIWIRDVVSRPDGTVTNMQDGTHLVSFSPTSIRINNVDAPTPSASIGAGSASIFALGFRPTPIDLATEEIMLPMVAIQYYDQAGVMRRKILPLGLLDWVQNGRRYAPSSGSVRLLPF